MGRTSLTQRLAELGNVVVFPPTPTLVDDVLDRIATPAPAQPRRQWLRAAAVTAAIVVALVAALPGPRRAIADLLGIGGVEITTVPQPPVGPAGDDFAGDSVTLEEAERTADFTLLLPSEQEPAAVFFDEAVPGGFVTLAYQPMPDGFEFVITEMLGSVDEPIVQKSVGPESTITVVDVGGDRGLWIEGAPHSLVILDRDGHPRVDDQRLAGNTLVFVRDGITVRIESNLEVGRVLAIAESLAPATP